MGFLRRFWMVFLGSVVVLIASPVTAELIYGTTVFRNLVSFDSTSPGTLLTNVPITGLVDQFESVAGLDFRPANGQLYALGNAPGSIYRLYTLNLTTGVATRVVGNTDLVLAGTNWGFDFNPAADRIRVVSDSNTSIRLNPNDGMLAGTDTNLNPAGSVVAVAYDRNDTNAGTPTTLFGIDSASDQLVRIGGVDGNPSPNGGVISNIGPLGADTLGFTSFDISNSGTAYAALSIGAPMPSTLYTINLGTGAASPVGQIGDGTDGITGLSVVVPEPAGIALVGIAAMWLGFRLRR
ncbi:MAG TPA: DUF4394 domain-containing protein [Pirellulaceae bacterium]